MLFNSYVFVCVFLPLSVISFYVLNRWSRTLAIGSLIAFSLVYYAYWNYAYVPLLAASILANFGVGRIIQRAMSAGRASPAKALMVAGIAGNLLLLAYFKYAYFIAGLFGAAGELGTIVLPLAISFYTFQQIMYLVDSLRGDVSKEGLLQYTLYVMFFPHLIAGPLVHHREMMPQFSSRTARDFRLDDVSVGLTIFAIGLAKKVLIADDLSQFVTPTFAAAAAGATPDFYTAWCAVLSYTFQIYFDFSGYSDMAIGAARLFGIRLPINFFSPYRATSIIDFWRWWHMTLSRLLRNYLYIPLGGNRKGKARRYANLMITMLLGGLWHGAGWTFVVWGGLHGAYLAINHGWRAFKAWLGWRDASSAAARAGARLLTFAAVVLAWVFFRSEDLPSALRMLSALGGAGGWSVPARIFDPATVAEWGIATSALPARPLILCLALAAFVWLAPNTYELTRRYSPALLPRDLSLDHPRVQLAWRPAPAWALACALVAAGALLGMLSGRSEFLYYQF